MEGVAMLRFRRAFWFVTLAALMAVWAGVLGLVGSRAEAGIIGSHSIDDGKTRDVEIARIRRCLEEKIVAQRLTDYGVTKEDAVAKIRTMSEKDLHRLASVSDRIAAGSGGMKWYWYVLIFVVLLGVLLLVAANQAKHSDVSIQGGF